MDYDRIINLNLKQVLAEQGYHLVRVGNGRTVIRGVSDNWEMRPLYLTSWRMLRDPPVTTTGHPADLWMRGWHGLEF